MAVEWLASVWAELRRVRDFSKLGPGLWPLGDEPLEFGREEFFSLLISADFCLLNQVLDPATDADHQSKSALQRRQVS